MNPTKAEPRCLDCGPSLNRRDFIHAATGVALAATAMPLVGVRTLCAAPTPKSSAESAVRRLYDSLTEEQRKLIVLPLDHEKRSRISANWKITEAAIATFSQDQQAIIRDVVRGVTSEDGYDRFMRQMDDDDGGFDQYAIAIFGNPGQDQFEFELTGRHLTLRADGNTMQGAAFGGPIVYGHGAEGNPKENLFWYQTQQANEVLKMLDGAQRDKALLAQSPREDAVQLRKDGEGLPGISGAELSPDQKEQLSKSIQAVLSPYRQEDIDEVMEIVQAGGGLDKVHMAFYRLDAEGHSADLADDQVWDVWRLESPTLVCHFRGAPHVHAYLNVARRA